MSIGKGAGGICSWGKRPGGGGGDMSSFFFVFSPLNFKLIQHFS